MSFSICRDSAHLNQDSCSNHIAYTCFTLDTQQKMAHSWWPRSIWWSGSLSTNFVPQAPMAWAGKCTYNLSFHLPHASTSSSSIPSHLTRLKQKCCLASSIPLVGHGLRIGCSCQVPQISLHIYLPQSSCPPVKPSMSLLSLLPLTKMQGSLANTCQCFLASMSLFYLLYHNISSNVILSWNYVWLNHWFSGIFQG